VKEADLLATLGRRLSYLRHERKLTQEQLAERAGIGNAYVAILEAGERSPSFKVLAALAEALRVEPWELLTDRRLGPGDDQWQATERKLAQSIRSLDRDDLTRLTDLAQRLTRRPRR